MGIVVEQIISGGQTGADQGGSEAAVTVGLEPGGWIPLGRRTQAGRLSDEKMALYRYREHPSAAYPPRTEQNVRDSDVTLWFGSTASPGYRCTRNACTRWGKPMHVNPPAVLIRELAKTYRIFNVAGNREESNPGIFQRTRDQLVNALGPHGTGQWCKRCHVPLTRADVEAARCTQCGEPR